MISATSRRRRTSTAVDPRTREDAAGIEVDDLVRRYGGRRGAVVEALGGVSFTVERGEVFGMLGPNGAGKTTLARILSTLLLPSAGHARVAGFDVVADVRAVRHRVGISFGGDLGLYLRLSAWDNLRYAATMYRVPRREEGERIAALLGRVGLLERAHDRVETFSTGMRQRLHIARALMHDPPVVVLDEPSAGLDPQASRDLRELVHGLASDGRAILLTTHDLLEAEDLCQRVAILHRGRLTQVAAPSLLRRQASESLGMCIEVGQLGGLTAAHLDDLPGLIRWAESADFVRIYTKDVSGAVAHLVAGGTDLATDLRISHPSLEDAYLATLSGGDG